MLIALGLLSPRLAWREGTPPNQSKMIDLFAIAKKQNKKSELVRKRRITIGN